MDICKRRGRPRKDDRRKHRYEVRLNEWEKGVLEYLCYEHDSSVSDVLRQALRTYYVQTKFGK